METHCDCPKPLNIVIGLFLIFVSILAIFRVWEIFMPPWAILISLILGLLSIILNSISRARQNGELTTEQANKLHSRDGF
ncbi:hypothetical protein C0580_04265 [Candidatus Parcubacteria bacterium]|nr:MAG: hypothetical protein C0580_04265 [Candidatus Parcubacteria bacterium]